MMLQRLIEVIGVNVKYHIKDNGIDGEQSEDRDEDKHHVPSLDLKLVIVPPAHYPHQAHVTP